MLKKVVVLFLCLIMLSTSLLILASDKNPNTDYLYNGAMGLASHFFAETETGTALENFANGFSPSTVAQQAYDIGAKWFMVMIHHNTMRPLCPSSTIDNLMGNSNYTTVRDVPSDLYTQLNSKGIKMMAYVNLYSGTENEVKKAMGANNGITDTYINNLAALWQEFSDRYGTKISGWYIDAAFALRSNAKKDIYLNQLAAALRHGNSNAVIAFSNGLAPNNFEQYHSETDFTAGEQCPFVASAYPTSRWTSEGVQWHTYTPLGDGAVGPLNWKASGTRYKSFVDVYNYVNNIDNGGGAITIDAMTCGNPFGQIVPEQYHQMVAVNSARTGYIYTTNLCSGKTATASSQYNTSMTPAKAVDGNASTIWHTVSGGEPAGSHPWWKVDLGSAKVIATVELLARQDSDQAEARKNFEIQASNSSDFSSYVVLASQGNTAFEKYAVWTRKVTNTNAYRYLRVYKTSGTMFNFAEFRAYQKK